MCLSDFLMTVRGSSSGLFCWPMKAQDYAGAAYGFDIAQRVFKALLASPQGELQRVRKAVWRKNGKGVSAVYQAPKRIAPDSLRFQQHGIGPLVEVREKKPKRYGWDGTKVTGKVLPLSGFKGQVEALQADMRLLNTVMGKHPLRSADGVEWSGCTRIFNDGRLDRGGRVYGRWQSEKAEKRLQCTIDGKPVCEIDVKGSYLLLAYKMTGGNGLNLGQDPYQSIDFVRSGPPHMRDLGKELLSALLSDSWDKKNFPRGRSRDEFGNVISVRKRHLIPKSKSARFYYDQILKAFPFIRQLDHMAGELMFLESTILIDAMVELAKREAPIPVYPIHDCLLCKQEDEGEVIRVLQHSFLKRIGGMPFLDVEYPDRESKIISPPDLQFIDLPVRPFSESSKYVWGITDCDDLILIE